MASASLDLPAICLGGHLLSRSTSCKLQSTFPISPLPGILRFCSGILVVLTSRICPASAGYIHAITASTNHSTGMRSYSCCLDIAPGPTLAFCRRGVATDHRKACKIGCSDTLKQLSSPLSQSLPHVGPTRNGTKCPPNMLHRFGHFHDSSTLVALMSSLYRQQ